MLKYSSLVLLPFFLICCKAVQEKDKFTLDIAKSNIHSAWMETCPEILKSLKIPIFKDTLVLLRDTTDFRNLLNESIERLSQKGGGTIMVPAGIYRVKGSIFLKSNIHLNLSEGCTLLFSPKPEDYLPVVKTKWEGTFCMNYAPLIYAHKASNIALTGKGVIDGQAEMIWHSWKELQSKDQALLRQMGNDQIPIDKRVFGMGHFLRPSGIQFIGCNSILLEDFTIKGSPFWTIHPVLSQNITARRLQILSGTTNDDGFDPENCSNVLIENCFFDTQDDCIAIKAGRDQDGWLYPPSENIIIRNNTFKTKVGSGFCIGSEMSGGVRNIFMENCSLQHSEKHAFQFKSNPDRGGYIEQVFIRDIKIGKVALGFEFSSDYKGWRGNTHFSRYRGFYIQDIQFLEVDKTAILLKGREEMPIDHIFFQNVRFQKAKVPLALKYAQNVLFDEVEVNGKIISP